MEAFVPSFSQSRLHQPDHGIFLSPCGDPAEFCNQFTAELPADREKLYGACSIESFRAAGALHEAHQDAGGFLDEVDRYDTPNFWRRDASVKSWIFADGPEAESPEQDLSDDMDSVRVFYHSGHGAMDDNGAFHVPMGALWEGGGATASSRQMRFGARSLRYLFWSASQSLRVTEGHSPICTWGRANQGARMMFGFGGSSWDSGNYGRYFWQHWRMGKTFSQSWLDASWDVSHAQSPVVAACGASSDQAAERLFGESRLQSERAQTDWWWWRWYEPEPRLVREPLEEPPADFGLLRLIPAAEDGAIAQSVIEHLGLARRGQIDPEGLKLRQGQIELACMPDGRVSLLLERSGRAQFPHVRLHRRLLVARARAALRRYGFVHPDIDLVFDRVALGMSCAATFQGSGQVIPRAIDEVIVQFRQAVNGVPIISPEAGAVRVALACDGTVLRIDSSLRRVASVKHTRAMAFERPVDDIDPGLSGNQHGLRQIHDDMAQISARLLRDLSARGAAPLQLRLLPGQSELGYSIRSNTGRMIARQGIEIECAKGFRKCSWISSSIDD